MVDSWAVTGIWFSIFGSWLVMFDIGTPYNTGFTINKLLKLLFIRGRQAFCVCSFGAFSDLGRLCTLTGNKNYMPCLVNT